jgi:hypothetical protein
VDLFRIDAIYFIIFTYMRKYNWYKEEEHLDEMDLLQPYVVKGLLEKWGVHPNDCENHGKFLTRLGEVAEQTLQNPSKDLE